MDTTMNLDNFEFPTLSKEELAAKAQAELDMEKEFSDGEYARIPQGYRDPSE